MSKRLQGSSPYGGNPCRSLFWFLEATCIPWLVAFFPTFKAGNTASPCSHLSLHSILLPPSSAPEDPCNYIRSTCVIRDVHPRVLNGITSVEFLFSVQGKVHRLWASGCGHFGRGAFFCLLQNPVHLPGPHFADSS